MKKIISLLLAIAMAFSIVAMAVSAVDYAEPFARGTLGSSEYRIPALWTLNNGNVLAVADMRYDHGSDSPNNIDILAAFSEDGYKPWNYNLVNYFDDYADDATGLYSASFIDSAIAQSSTGRIFVISDACPSGGGYWQAKEGTGFVKVGDKNYLLLTDLQRDNKPGTFNYYMGEFDENGMATVFYRYGDNANTATAYTVDKDFNLYKNGVVLKSKQINKDGSEGKEINQNIFYGSSELTCYLTTYLLLKYSDDNGATWSNPIFISADVKSDKEGFLGIGPGRGLVTNVNGKERIIFAVYDNVGYGATVHNENVSTIYSDDNGLTWNRGAETQCRAFMTKTSEAQLVDLGNGKLRMFARNQGRYVAYADSTDGGHSWTKFRSDLDLPSNGNCMVSFINAEVDGKQFVLGSYASSKQARKDGVIRVGVVENGDINWINTYYFGGDFFAYSCMTQLADGNIGILYENEASRISYMILTLDKDGNLSEINGNNFEGYKNAPKTINAFVAFFDKIFSALGLI